MGESRNARYMPLLNLKLLRKSMKITQAELSNLCGISRTGYSMIERGIRRLSIDRLCLLADYLNTSTDFILERTDDSTPPRSPFD